MPTQSRVPGAASSEVDFELERFERTSEDRIEISGRWYGLRGRRFVRPVLNLHTGGGSRRRAIALLEHKPWAADDGETWLAAFAWPQGAGHVEGAELEVGPGLIVDLPAPGGKPGSQGRVSALRPHAPAPMARRIVPVEGEEGDAAAAPAHDHAPDPVRHDRAAAHPAPRPGAHDRTGRPSVPDKDAARPAGSDRSARSRARARSDSVQIWDTAPARARSTAPPRDVMTAALEERDEALAARDAAERDRVQALNDRDDARSRRDAALRDVDRAVTERDEAVAQRERFEAELERVTRERDVADAERKRMMQDAEAVERDRDQAAAERDGARSELSRALPERDQALREAEAAGARADRAESERDTAFAERKTAVAQRDRARRERDRAMRAVGVEPPVESPLVGPQRPGADAAEAVAGAGRAADLRADRGAGRAADRSAGQARDPGVDRAADPGADRSAGRAADPGAGQAGDPGADRRAGRADRSAGRAAYPGAGGAGDPGADRRAGRAADPGAGRAADPGADRSAGRAAYPGAGGAADLGADRRAGRAADRGAPRAADVGAAAPAARSVAAPPGTPLPSRPMKRIGSTPSGPTPEPKPLLTPVDSGRPRRLSRTRRPPSAPARWAVRIIAMLVLIAVVVVLGILLASVV